MLTIKDSNQVRTMRQVKSYRSCPTSTGLPMWGAELGRMCQEEVAPAPTGIAPPLAGRGLATHCGCRLRNRDPWNTP